jgi:hypothetical protein
MNTLNLPFTIYHLPLISYFSFFKPAATPGFKWQMINANLSGLRSQSYFGGVGLKIENCKLLIRLIKKNYMPRPSLPSLKDRANLARSYIIEPAAEGS